MTKYQFEYYLHDNYESSEIEETLEDQGIPPEVAASIARVSPFYEVRFICEYDSETFETTVVKVEL